MSSAEPLGPSPQFNLSSAILGIVQPPHPPADQSSTPGPVLHPGTTGVPPLQYAADVDDPAGDQPIRMPPSARPTRTSDEEVRYAVACILRREELWPLLSVGADGRSPDTPSMPIALSEAGHRLLSLVWAFAAQQYVQRGALPEVEACRVELHARVQQLPRFEAISVTELDAFFGYVAGSHLDHVDVEYARGLTTEILETHLCLIPLSRQLRDWQRSRSPIDDELDRAQGIRAELAALRSGSGNDGPFTLAEFRQQVRERVEIVRGVLVEGQLGIIGGPSKSLKTLIALDMAISIATGAWFLGQDFWSCDRPRKVGFYSGESGGATLVAKFDAICRMKLQDRGHLLPAEVRNTFEANVAANTRWKTVLPDLDNAASLRQLQREVRRHHIEVLFLDPLLLCMGAAAKDLANAAVVGEVLTRANRAVLEEGCTLILLHHSSGDRARRSSPQAREPLELADLAYAGITNFVRQWTTINRAAAYEPETHRSELWLSIGGSGMQAGGTYHVNITEGHCHDQWRVQVDTQASYIECERNVRQTQRHRREAERDSRVLRYLLAQPDGASVRNMVRDSTSLGGIGESGIRAALAALARRSGVRIRSERRGRGELWFAEQDRDPREWPQRDVGQVADGG